MSVSGTKPAVITEAELAKVRALEAKLGSDVVVVAYDQPTLPAELTPDQLALLQQLERELGHVVLVAWQKPF